MYSLGITSRTSSDSSMDDKDLGRRWGDYLSIPGSDPLWTIRTSQTPIAICAHSGVQISMDDKDD